MKGIEIKTNDDHHGNPHVSVHHHEHHVQGQHAHHGHHVHLNDHPHVSVHHQLHGIQLDRLYPHAFYKTQYEKDYTK